MRTTYSLVMTAFALVVSGCAGLQDGFTSEQRNALAPTGKLRVGFLSTTPIHATKDAASGEFKGPAVDLGKEMARRIGVQFEPVPYTSFVPVLAGAKSGEWDIAMMGISAERERIVDFTAPYMVVEFGYLVPSGSPISTLADVDKPGVRIGVLEKSSPDAFLSRTIQRATLVRVASIANMLESLNAGKVDALYATKANMLAEAAKIPGSRVLEGRFGGEEAAVAVPKGRQLSVAYAGQLVDEAVSKGIVKAAIERAGLRGVVVAPHK
ncbi:MAG TPA: transporter substrate-binding domain-containing protein [Burkholderiaceae bacterium]|nr:transporter substrate-binding domain-containing protein [Burkholderiaceae bacterium]